MPLLRPFDSPTFGTFGEAIECVRQLFEVRFPYSLSEITSPLIYLRDCSLCMKIISHIGAFSFYPVLETRQLDCFRDLKSNNFMIESEKMIPEGCHPRKDLRKPDLSGPARFYTRTQCPSKYFIIDFGMSRRYESDNDSPVESTVTEKGVQLQNPFQVDVYLAGELLRQVFLDVSQASSFVMQIILTILVSPRYVNHSWIHRF